MRRFGRLARFGAVGPFLGEIGGGRRRREHRIALREQPPRREQRPGADHRAGDRMIALAAPDAEPRATDYIAEMVQMIATLVDKGHAYPADNGDVFYSVNSFASYGRSEESRGGGEGVHK